MGIITLYFANQAEPRLVEVESASNAAINASQATGLTVYIFFRVYKVSGGVETELTAGWTAAGSRAANGVSEVDTDWACPATAFAAGDKIRVYIKVTVGVTSNQGSFDSVTTHTGLLASTWTFHLWLERDFFLGITDVNLYYGTLAVFPSRITNVSIGTVGGVAPVKRFIKMDAGSHPRSRSLYRYKLKKWVSIVAKAVCA